LGLPIAVKFESKADVRKRPVFSWDVVGNRFRGNAKLPPDFDEPPTGTFGICVSMSAGRDTVGDVRAAGNTFSGCQTQVKLHAEGSGDFVRAACVTDNIGEGTPVVLEGVDAVLVGGNLQSAGNGVGTTPAGVGTAAEESPHSTRP
jgi:hypothetical protein